MPTLVLGATALNIYAVVLILARGMVFRTRVYRPMLWNIFLSILPILILVLALFVGLGALIVSRVLGYIVLIACAIIWLLVLPNASYLITELNQSHRRADDRVPLWFDIIMVITLAMSGVINTVVNLFTAHTLNAFFFYGDYATSYVEPVVLATLAVVLLLVAFGMYLGRYLRFNSWDLRRPAAFVKKFWQHFAIRDNRLAATGFTLTYAIFLALIYVVTAGPLIESLIQLEELR